MPRDSKDSALTLRLPPSLHDKLRERAAAEDRTVSQVLRVAALTYLASENHVPPLAH